MVEPFDMGHNKHIQRSSHSSYKLWINEPPMFLFIIYKVCSFHFLIAIQCPHLICIN